MPDYPKVIHSLLGDVPVVLREQIDGEDNCGYFHHDSRSIVIKSTLPEAVIWHTIWHEQLHLILSDSGVAQILTKKQEEAVCDAYATFHDLCGVRSGSDGEAESPS